MKSPLDAALDDFLAELKKDIQEYLQSDKFIVNFQVTIGTTEELKDKVEAYRSKLQELMKRVK